MLGRFSGKFVTQAVILESVPLQTSLEWDLGQRYYSTRGNKAFIGDSSPIPFVVNNDGSLSRNVAEVFFHSLVASDTEKSLDPDIFVLEIGIGTGLFARYFLDHFQELCRTHRKDYYERLTYIAADFSQKMLKDLVRNGVLANHPGRYKIRHVDATNPKEWLPRDLMFVSNRVRTGQSKTDDTRPVLRGVFLNYLLDSLPATVLERDGEQVKELYVRTCVARNVNLADFTDMSIEALRYRAESKDPALREEILEVYGILASEYDYRPVDINKVPYGSFVADFLKKRANKLLHNYGAMQCLEQLLDMVHPGGIILVNDYGQTQIDLRDEFEHQRFSYATSVGLNFPLLKAYFDEGKRCEWVEPFGEAGGIHARLLGRQLAHATRERFQELFGEAAYKKRQEPWDKARECLKVGRFELGLSFYEQALELQPRNWVLMNEVASFLIFQLRELKAGIDMAKSALALNPSCSADLWCTLGDGLLEFGRLEEAKSAYLKAIDINDTNMRARFHLAIVHQREKDYPAALTRVAEALALDRTGEMRDRMLHKQQEILAQLAMKHQQEYLLLVNLVSKYGKKNEAKPAGADSI